MIVCPNCKTEYTHAASICPACDFQATISGRVLLWDSDLGDINFPIGHFEKLEKHESTFFWFQARKKLILYCLTKYFTKLENILEVGCGTGFILTAVAKNFPGVALSGSDVYLETLNILAAKFSTQITSNSTPTLIRMDARNMPYCNEFDAIIACDVIEHISDDQLVLDNFYAATKSGGSLLITVPQHQWLWSAVDESLGHVRRYKASDLHAKVKNAGWSIVFSSSFVSLLLPAMILSRLRMGNHYENETSISPRINRLMGHIMNLEFKLTKLGLKFPCGGSRVLVAKKL